MSTLPSEPLIIEENQFTLAGRTNALRPERMLRQLDLSVTIDVLPPNTVWVSPKRNSLIMQRPPEYRTVSIRENGTPECYCSEEGECNICTGDYSDSIEHHHGIAEGWDTYRLPMPWVTYVFTVGKTSVSLIRIFANPGPLVSPTQILGFMPLPNLYSNGGICAGSASLEAPRTDQSVSQAVGEILESFWGSAFNGDIRNDETSEIFRAIDDISKDSEETIYDLYKVWERLEIEEALQLPWEREAEYELESLLDELLIRENSLISKYHTNGSHLYSAMRQNCLLSRF